MHAPDGVQQARLLQPGMGCSGSKPLPPPTAATQPLAAVAPAGVLRASKHSGKVAGAAAAAPAPVPRASFKAVIQKQLAAQAFEHAGDTYRRGQVCRTQHASLSSRREPLCRPLCAQEVELSMATKEAPERETRSSKTQLQRASIVDTQVCCSPLAHARTRHRPARAQASPALPSAPRPPLPSATQEAELSEADRDRPGRQRGSQMTEAASPSCAAKRRGTAPGYPEGVELEARRPATYYLPEMLLNA